MKPTNCRTLPVLVCGLALAGCMASPAVKSERAVPEKLIVSADGSMQLGDRLIANDDVIIYQDGFRCDKAAVRVRMQPLHPDFFRDSIVVEYK